MSKIKKLLLGLVTFAAMAVLCAVCVGAAPYSYKELPDGTIEITYCGLTDGKDVVIPSTIDGKKVTSIGENAFNGWLYYRYKSITIPDSVTNIGEKAFYDQFYITSIKLPDGLKTLGKNAFSECSALKTVTIPGSVATIEAKAFAKCENLESVVISEGVRAIDENVFYECGKLKSVTIPSSVTSIADWQFYYCNDELNLNIDCRNAYAINYVKDNGLNYTVAHKFGEWKLIKPATCTVAGSYARTCSVCGEKIIMEIEPTGHKYVDTVVNPTYTARGYTLHKCSVCAYSFKDSYKPALTLGSISNLKVGGRASNAIRLNWSEHPGANGYIIEQYKSGKWVQLATIPSNETTTYRISGLSASTAYKFRVQAYKTITDGTAKSSYAEITAATNPTTVTGFKVGGRSADAIRLNWTKNTTASGYIIEMYNGSAWIRVGKITGNATTTYRISGLLASTVYKFRVQAYKSINGGATKSGYTTLSARTNPKAVSGFKTGAKTTSAIRLNWNKNTGADGYVLEIYKGGKWVQLTTIASNATTTYRISGLAKNATYKIRIKAYKMSGSTALYSGYTTISGKTTA